MNYKTFFQKNNLPILVGIVLLPLVASAANLIEGIVPCGNTNNYSTSRTQALCTLADLVKLVDNVIYFALFYLAVPLAVLWFAIGGLLMITARGDTGQLQRGKDIFYNTVIGFVVAFGAYLIVEAIIYALTGNANLSSWLGGRGIN